MYDILIGVQYEQLLGKETRKKEEK